MDVAILVSSIAVMVRGYSETAVTCKHDGGYSPEVSYYDKFQTDYFMSGVQSSYHRNNNEDRTFWLNFCKPNNAGNDMLVSHHFLPPTNYHTPFHQKCGYNEAMMGWSSVWSSHYKDRAYRFKCGKLAPRYQLHNCAYTGYKNELDGMMTNWRCPGNGLVTRVYSTLNNYNRDRQFSFQCCKLYDVPAAYQVGNAVDFTIKIDANYINEYDGMLILPQHGYFMSGIWNSIHDNNKEDRRWKFKYVLPTVSSAGYTSAYNLAKTSYQSQWTIQCKQDGLGGLIGAYSVHDNNKEDREWTFLCGKIDTTKYRLTNCKLGRGNSGDQQFQSLCPDNGIINGIISSYSSQHKDRSYKLYCCNLYAKVNPSSAHSVMEEPMDSSDWPEDDEPSIGINAPPSMDDIYDHNNKGPSFVIGPFGEWSAYFVYFIAFCPTFICLVFTAYCCYLHKCKGKRYVKYDAVNNDLDSVELVNKNDEL